MRELERTTRVNVTAFVECAGEAGLSRTDACALLGVDPRTVSTWRTAATDELLPRGRPSFTGTAAVRDEVAELVHLVGAHVSVAWVHGAFAAVISRRETHALVLRARAELQRAFEAGLALLDWQRPGAVWAMDWKTPPTPIDGIYVAVLVVRDLASGMLLLALPVADTTGATAARALEALHVEHGPALVMKSDNGSNLICDETQAPLRSLGVELLRSPPGTPSYNGACEAGIGSLTTRAAHEAARDGRPGRWTSDDVEVARRQANELVRHADLGGRTAAETWAGRVRITPEERAAFRAAADHQREGFMRHLIERGEDVAEPRTQQFIERVAIKGALIERGLLSIRGRADCLHDWLRRAPNIP
jgi:transposase InsO family protein